MNLVFEKVSQNPKAIKKTIPTQRGARTVALLAGLKVVYMIPTRARTTPGVTRRAPT